MKLTRQAVINRRKQAQRHESNKKIAKVVNAGLVLFASASTLSTLTAPKVTVQAQTATQQNFLSTIGGYARDIAKNNDLYASVMIAQAILESGWGQSGLASAPNYNLFGIKGDYNGNSVRMDTLEDDGSGNYYAAKEPFRKYSNYGESLNDYASLLTGDNNPNSWRYKFYYGARVSATNSYQDATQHLTGRYATDTRYASKLNQLIQTYGLTQYDVGGSSTASPARPQAPATGGGSYTVQAGDSYWRIANKYGISIEELQRLNGTSSYFLYPGQSLVVPGSASTTSGSASSASSSTSTSSAGGNYTVQAGDSYWRIANKYGISIQELQRLNGTSDYTLHPGQSIKVPGSGTNASASSNSSSASTSTTSAAPAAGGSYTVQAGDSYWRIANKYGISISELQRLNGTSDYNLYPGQSLKVPGSGSSSSASASSNGTSTSTSTTSAAPATGGSYTVQAGDSYWRIANKYGISISELQRLNGTSNYFLYPGQSIKVPGSGSANATPAPAATTASTTSAPAETPAPAPETFTLPFSCSASQKKCTIKGFKVDGRVPNEAEIRDLRVIASTINQFAEGGSIDFVGHTDSTGSDAYNQKLSVARAQNVANLLRQHGLKNTISYGRISGQGEKNPISTNDTVDGRYNNRRVELFFQNVDFSNVIFK